MGNNSTGITGIAYNAKIIPVRIGYINSSGSFIVDLDEVAYAFNWSLDNNVDVISNSYELGSSSANLSTTIRRAVNNGRNGKGSIVLFSSGDDAGGNGISVSYPARLNSVIAVGATSMCDERKSLSSCDGENWSSNYNDNLDIVAPGVEIYTTDMTGAEGFNSSASSGNYYSSFSGTSAACPNTAGVVALILSANPNLTENQARNILEQNTDKVGGYTYSITTGHSNGTYNEQMGYGRVNAVKAVQEAFFMNTTLSGPDNVCTSNTTFNLSQAANGINTVWQISSNLQLVSSNNTQITVKAINSSASGSAYIKAIISEHETRKDVWVGTQTIDYVEFANSYDNGSYFCSSHTGNTYTIYPKINGNSYQYRILAFPSLNVLYTSSITNSNIGTVYYTPSPGWYVFEARMTNSCGTSNWAGFEVEYVDCTLGGGGGGGSGEEFVVYPNPSSFEINISPQNDASSELAIHSHDIVQLRLFDFFGNLWIEKKQGNLTKLNISQMKEGMYYLEITSNTIREIHRIIIQK